MLDLPNPAIIGVIHLPALPGSPLHILGLGEIIDRALADARILKNAGFDAVVVENLGDVPLPPENLSPASVAAMAVIAAEVRRDTKMRMGINALRNDARAALGVAVATDAAFVRINVHCGVAATDQGMIEGRADDTLRYRKLLGKRIAILADVHVKHATPINEPDIARAAQDTAYRGLADGLILTGPATGEPADPKQIELVRRAVPDRRLFIGSGVTEQSVRSLIERAGGIIVGTALKRDRKPSSPIDPDLAESFVNAAKNA